MNFNEVVRIPRRPFTIYDIRYRKGIRRYKTKSNDLRIWKNKMYHLRSLRKFNKFQQLKRRRSFSKI